MKRTTFPLLVLSFFCISDVLNAQNTQLQKCESKIKMLTTQRDSVEALYFFALTRLDSLTGDYFSLEKQVKEMDEQLTQLKTELHNVLEKKNDTTSELIKAKKIIADQNVLIQKLEAEVKRLSQNKKHSN